MATLLNIVRSGGFSLPAMQQYCELNLKVWFVNWIMMQQCNNTLSMWKVRM